MAIEYSQTLRRLQKITASFEQLVKERKELINKLSKRDEPLIAKVRKLEQAISASSVQAAARERVLASLTASKEMPTVEDIEKQLRKEDRETAKES